MTDPEGAGAGFPAGHRPGVGQRAQPAGYTGVFLCERGPYQQPSVLVPTAAADATLYGGFAYVPAGVDLAAAVKAARSAGSGPADGRHGNATAPFAGRVRIGGGWNTSNQLFQAPSRRRGPPSCRSAEPARGRGPGSAPGRRGRGRTGASSVTAVFGAFAGGVRGVPHPR
ncbi:MULTISPECIES: hypothetical protein [unclassified Streptomyces]|uniref:hypothetical protein n=1 Tax=unclassified Streptomyces TaxID=2593676 RepID=UPI0036E2CB26